MPEAMYRIDIFKTFRAQGFVKMFFAYAINTVPGKFFSALIDKQAVLIQRFWFDTVFGDIDFDELDGSGFELYLTITIAFAQDDQRVF